jgi:molecular chaperone GrpE
MANARMTRPATAISSSSLAPRSSLRLFSSDAKEEKGADASAGASKNAAPEDAVHVHIKELEEEIKVMKDKLLRSYAEEENVRRIARRDVENARDYANTKFAKSLLDVADNLERALDAIHPDQKASADGTLKTLLEGVQMTSNGLQKVFQQHGIERVRDFCFLIPFRWPNHCIFICAVWNRGRQI